MKSEDHLRLIQELESSTEAVGAVLAEVPEGDLRRRFRDDGWSIAGCVEHICLVDERFGARIAQATVSSEPVYNERRAAVILRDVPLREQRFQAPEAVIPKDKFTSAGEAMAALRASRESLGEILTQRSSELRQMQVEHPLMGIISGYEAFLLVAAHARRHANQMREIHSELRAGAQAG